MKQTLASILLIGFFALAAGAGTYAYFFDTESSTGNIFTAGSLDLKLKDGDEYFSNGIHKTWVFDDVKPGDEMYGNFDFKNFGTVRADHSELSADYTIIDPLGPESDTEENTPADEMAGVMEFALFDYYYSQYDPPINVTPLVPDLNGNGKRDLYDLKYSGGVDNLYLPQAGVQFGWVDIIFKMGSDVGNNFQGDTLNVTISLTMNQDASQ